MSRFQKIPCSTVQGRLHRLVTVATAREMHRAFRGRFSLCGRPVGAIPGCDTPSSLLSLFRSHFPELCTRYEADFAKSYGPGGTGS